MNEGIKKRIRRLEDNPANSWIAAETAVITYKSGEVKRVFGDIAVQEALDHPETIEKIEGGGGQLPDLAAVLLL